jgi:hypothetical protein
MSTTTEPLDLAALIAEVREEVERESGPLDWAEDEIARAMRRHPDQADLLWHAFKLIQPRAGMRVEFVYRGYARELLERLATGQDTRLGTAVEVCLVCMEVSKVVPMHGAPAGLYTRMWLQACPDNPVHDGQPGELAHYEALYSSQLDELEAEVRRRTTDPTRVLGEITCKGQHHGENVRCRFVPPPAPVRELVASRGQRVVRELTADASGQFLLPL